MQWNYSCRNINYLSFTFLKKCYFVYGSLCSLLADHTFSLSPLSLWLHCSSLVCTFWFFVCSFGTNLLNGRVFQGCIPIGSWVFDWHFSAQTSFRVASTNFILHWLDIHNFLKDHLSLSIDHIRCLCCIKSNHIHTQRWGMESPTNWLTSKTHKHCYTFCNCLSDDRVFDMPLPFVFKLELNYSIYYGC